MTNQIISQSQLNDIICDSLFAHNNGKVNFLKAEAAYIENGLAKNCNFHNFINDMLDKGKMRIEGWGEQMTILRG